MELRNRISFRKVLVSAVLASVLSACSDENVEQDGLQHITRASAYEGQGQYRAAMIEYKNAIQKSGGTEAAYLPYANMLNRLTQHAAALSILETYEGQKSQAYYSELVEAYVGMKKYMSAEKTMAEFVSDDNRALKLLSAEIALGQGDLNEAMAVYETLLRENPNDGKALLGKANLLLRQENSAEATKLLTGIGKQDESYLDAQLVLSGIHIVQGNLEQAESALTELLSDLPNTDVMEPEKAAVLQRLSYVLTRLGRSNEAYVYTKLLSEAFPGANEMAEQYKKAVDLFKEGKLEESESLLASLVEEYPHNNRASQLLGIVNYLQGDTEQALESLSGSIDPEIADPLATHIYAASTLKMNDPKKVLEILEPTIERTTKAETWALYGLAAVSDNQYKKGESALNKAISLAPENVKLHLLLATYYRDPTVENKDLELSHLEKAYDLAPTDFTVLRDMLGFYARQGDQGKAESFIRDQIKTHGEQYSSQLIAGYFYVADKNIKQAKTHFSKASELELEGAKYRNALFALGRTELQLNEFDSAVKTFTKIADQFPESLLGYQGMFAAVNGQKDLNAAIDLLASEADKRASLKPYEVIVRAAVANHKAEIARTYLNKIKSKQADYSGLKALEHSIVFLEAVAQVRSGHMEKARESIASVLTDAPDHTRVLSLLVEIELKSGNAKEAEKVLGQLVSVQPDYPLLSLLKGDVAVANKDLPVAKSQYRLAWEKYRTELAANKYYRVLDLLKDNQTKRDHLKDWLSVHPDSESAMLFSAMDAQMNGQDDTAREQYQALLESNSDNVTVLNNLGWMYFEANDSRALSLLEKAANLAPENPAVLDSYGWVLAQTGQVEKGIGYLEKALSLAPDVAEIAKHLEEARKL